MCSGEFGKTILGIRYWVLDAKKWDAKLERRNSENDIRN